MTYTFKLARRLARFRMASVITGALLAAACAGDEGLNGPAAAGGDPGTSVLTILPDSTTVRTSDTVQFSVGALAEGSTLSFSRGGGKGKGRGKPQPAGMTVSPGTATLISTGEQRFVAMETMTDGSSWQPRVTWTATGGTIDSTGKYVASSTPGEYRVVAVAADGMADTATATVVADTPVLARLVLSPPVDTVATGGKQQFSVVATDSDGANIAVVPTYTATGGTITAAGVYTAGQTAGTFRVIALDPTSHLADTAAVTVTATLPTVQSVVLTPGSASLTTGAKQQFNASVKMSDGTTKAISASYSATGGSIAASGEYTAGSTAGTYRVIAAESGGKADTAAVTITALAPPPPSTSVCDGALRTVAVSTAGGLTTAIGSSQPGDCILLAAGTYTTGTIRQSRGGTAANPVTVRGAGSSSIVTMGGGSWLPQAPYLRFENFRLTNTFYGFYCGESGAPGCPYAVFDSMEVDHAAQSGIALENGSSFSQVLRSRVHDTGVSRAVYGEGVYVGGYGTPTTDVKVLNNTFYNTGAEAIDNSAGADRMTATGNVIDGTGTAFIDGGTVSLVGLRGNNVVFSNNTLTKGSPHGIVVWSGSGTVLRGNTIHLFNIDNYPAPKGIDASRASGTQVGCDNIVTDVPSGGMAYTGSCAP